VDISAHPCPDKDHLCWSLCVTSLTHSPRRHHHSWSPRTPATTGARCLGQSCPHPTCRLCQAAPHLQCEVMQCDVPGTLKCGPEQPSVCTSIGCVVCRALSCRTLVSTLHMQRLAAPVKPGITQHAARMCRCLQAGIQTLVTQAPQVGYSLTFLGVWSWLCTRSHLSATGLWLGCTIRRHHCHHCPPSPPPWAEGLE
jgi:hypothetical protein